MLKHVNLESSKTETASSRTAKTITAPEGSNITRPISQRSAFIEMGTDNESIATLEPYEESVATESTSSEFSDCQSFRSEETVSQDIDLEFEYERDDDQSSVDTVYDNRQCLPRPKAGWDTSSFATFGNLAPAGNITEIFPNAPNTARMQWNIATGGMYGHNAGTPDAEYLDRIEKVIAPRLHSRTTTDKTRAILSRLPELMPPNSNWATLTSEVWPDKFPDSTIHPDQSYQNARDPNINVNLPMDLFADDDYEYVRRQPMKATYQFNRKQKPVAQQGSSLNNMSEDDMERMQIQAHVTRATNQIQDSLQPDPQMMEAMVEFETYLNTFLDHGDKWKRPAGLSTQISKFKNVNDQDTFEQGIFLARNYGLLMYFHPRWLQEQFRDKKGNFLFQLNSAEMSEMHELILRFLSIGRIAHNFGPIIKMLR